MSCVANSWLVINKTSILVTKKSVSLLDICALLVNSCFIFSGVDFFLSCVSSKSGGLDDILALSRLLAFYFVLSWLATLAIRLPKLTQMTSSSLVNSKFFSIAAWEGP